MTAIYKFLPIVVVCVCVGFFIYAFNITAESGGDSCDMSYATYYVKGTNNCDTSYVCIPAEQWARLGRIAEKEHARFRAELGTWLSVFGLLSIIATVIVPVASYRLNLEDFHNRVGALEKSVKGLENRSADQTQKMDVQESIVKEVEGIEDAKQQGDVKLAEIIENCRQERRDILKGNYDASEKAERMVAVLKKVNDEVLLEACGSVVIKLALDFINTINIQLGKRDVRNSQFERAFNVLMHQDKPLSLTVQDLSGKYDGDNKRIYIGFYKAMHDRQEG